MDGGEMVGDEMDGDEAAFDDDEEETAAELLEQAQRNAQAAVIATVAFLQERGVAVAAWAEAVGRTFARGWDEPRPWDADEFMDAMLTNFRSFGAVVISAELTPERAEAVVLRFPDEALCDLFGVAVAEAAQFNDAAVVIARERGLAWTWRREGERTRYVARRASGTTTGG